jgi:hypothetical protein
MKRILAVALLVVSLASAALAEGSYPPPTGPSSSIASAELAEGPMLPPAGSLAEGSGMPPTTSNQSPVGSPKP